MKKILIAVFVIAFPFCLFELPTVDAAEEEIMDAEEQKITNSEIEMTMNASGSCKCKDTQFTLDQIRSIYEKLDEKGISGKSVITIRGEEEDSTLLLEAKRKKKGGGGGEGGCICYSTPDRCLHCGPPCNTVDCQSQQPGTGAKQDDVPEPLD